ncbi:MAG: hypothetical protein AB1899_08530, partial [Pseudomonadota bacterium]
VKPKPIPPSKPMAVEEEPPPAPPPPPVDKPDPPPPPPAPPPRAQPHSQKKVGPSSSPVGEGWDFMR